MVACAALLSIQPPNHLAVPMTACAQTVEDLKERLLFAVENDKEELCESLLEDLRKAVTNREILELTRVGFHVNNVRRNYLKKWPQLSKKCRDMIKQWQDFIVDEKGRPHSATSSSSTTPNVLSPSMAKLARRGITPNTPINRRVTSTGLQGRISATVSPANGSYAPSRSQISPIAASATTVSMPASTITSATAATTNGIHKSQSVGVELLSHNSSRPLTPLDDSRNGKRKHVEEPGNLPIKRTKTVTGSLVSPSTTQSVSAARKAVQSTSELVAQLSQNLPQHMNIDSSIREHEEKMKREHKDDEVSINVQASTSHCVIEKKKRKYEKKQKKLAIETEKIGGEERPRGGLVIRFGSKNGAVSFGSDLKLEEIETMPFPSSSNYFEPSRSVPKETTPPPSNEGVDQIDGRKAMKKTGVNGKRKNDWSSLIPSMEELKIRAERDEEEKRQLVLEMAEQTKKEPTKVQRIKNYRRPILMLPYLDNPLGPDFLVHKYRNSAQYYSDVNFLYGEERPGV